MTPIAYLAHPVGHGPIRRLNITRAKLWLRTLVEISSDVAISAPWLPYVETLDEETYRERGIRDDLACLGRCDLLIAVGGQWSPGMIDERGLMQDRDAPIVDLTTFPADPRQLVGIQRADIGIRIRHGVRALRGDGGKA